MIAHGRSVSDSLGLLKGENEYGRGDGSSPTPPIRPALRDDGGGSRVTRAPHEMKRALISGVSGQDGAYLARLLLDRGYTVVGTSRDPATASLESLTRLGVHERVSIEAARLDDTGDVERLIERIEPDEIYHLACQSSVAVSFERLVGRNPPG